MNKLYPMVRRVRRPLLPEEEGVSREVAKEAKEAKDARGKDELHESPSQAPATSEEKEGSREVAKDAKDATAKPTEQTPFGNVGDSQSSSLQDFALQSEESGVTPAIPPVVVPSAGKVGDSCNSSLQSSSLQKEAPVEKGGSREVAKDAKDATAAPPKKARR